MTPAARHPASQTPVTRHELEPDGAALTRMLTETAGLLAEFVDALPDGTIHAARPLPDVDQQHLLGPPPEQPGDLPGLLKAVAQARQSAVETASSRFFGYVPGGGVVTSAVGELISRTLNHYSTIAEFAPALVAMEEGILRWVSTELGMPPGAGGLITTGGSSATLSAVVAARTALLGDDLAAGTIYASAQAHHSLRKAARIAGLPAASYRTVPTVATTAGPRLDVAAARAMIDADRRAGRRPFLLVATAGTTNTGTVDPLTDLVRLAREQGMWAHVDACYGGFFQLTARGRRLLTGIGEADSIALDPHKGLFLPYGTGMLLTRDRAMLAAAHTEDGDYMPDQHDLALPDYAQLGCELSREQRGLRLWLPLHLHGAQAFRRALDEKLDLAHWAHGQVLADDRLVAVHEPELSVVAFRTAAGGDQANRRLLERINGTGRVYLSGTQLDGKFTLRLCVLSHRSHAEEVAEALDIVRRQLGPE